MKFDNQSVHIIKIALVNRIYQLDQYILETKDGKVKDFLEKERKDNINLIKYIDER